MKAMKKIFSNRVTFALAAFATFLTSSAAQAHTGMGHADGFAHGFAHPVGGWDHLLAMIAVGLWASQLARTSKKALWMVPMAFVGVLAIGGALGAAGVAMPMVEQGILMSVLVLGVLVAAAARLPLAASIATVSAFAMFHGHAHGAEMPTAASGLSYGLGFVLATALLHGVGLAVGVLSQQKISLPATRLAGAAIALSSFVLFLQ